MNRKEFRNRMKKGKLMLKDKPDKAKSSGIVVPYMKRLRNADSFKSDDSRSNTCSDYSYSDDSYSNYSDYYSSDESSEERYKNQELSLIREKFCDICKITGHNTQNCNYNTKRVVEVSGSGTHQVKINNHFNINVQVNFIRK